MKRIIGIFVLVFLIIGLCQAQEGSDAVRFMRQQNTLSLPFFYHDSEIQVGAVFSLPGQWMPVLAVAIPFGGNYYIQGALGASREKVFSDARSMFQVAFSYSDVFAERKEWSYAVNVFFKHYNATGFETLVTGINVGVGRSLEKFELFAAMDLSIQHYEIFTDSVFPETQKRIYVLMPKLIFRSSYGNISVAALPGIFSLGTSWSLKMGKK
jgi:hypothetical protein